MKNWKLMAVALIAGLIATIGNTTCTANAAGIGFVNYKKVQDNYSYAQEATKQIDAEGLKLQQYLIDKEKQYKALETPIKKQNFEERTTKEFKEKEAAYMQMKMKKEAERSEERRVGKECRS